MSERISRREFLKKVGLAGAVALAITNLNEVEVNNQPPQKMRICCYAIENYAIPEPVIETSENKINYNEFIKRLELTPLSPQVYKNIPNTHLKDIKRLSNDTNINKLGVFFIK